ncbi:sensor histidine kinase [Tenacibaculum sp. 190524A02b]|uniref:sensor histidine kinase n=1 Tax=Tenacibaculum vairaonense TaxID=3137860 RepID=UPI0032B29FB1
MKKNKVIQHLLFWIALLAIYALSFNGNGEYYHYYLKNTLLKFPFYIIAVYTFNYWQVPLYLNKGRIAVFSLSVFFTSFIIYVLFKYSIYVKDNYPMYLFNIPAYLSKTLMFYTPALIVYAYKVYINQQEETNRLIRIQQEKLDTELQFLKAQLNPHFLFNTLNNLYSFVMTNSPKAGDMILQLSEILDYSLYKSQARFIDIKEELKCIDNYINLEKIRYGERLHVEFERKTPSLKAQISPLLLLSIVENAFKHGASGNLENPIIRISIKQIENKLYFSVWNTKNHYVNGAIGDAYKEGIGLKNIQRQLNLLYPNKHELNIIDKLDHFSLHLQITID